MGSGCGTVGKAIASNNRDPWFKSNHQQILFTINCIEKTEINKNTPSLSLIKIFWLSKPLFCPQKT